MSSPSDASKPSLLLRCKILVIGEQIREYLHFQFDSRSSLYVWDTIPLAKVNHPSFFHLIEFSACKMDQT